MLHFSDYRHPAKQIANKFIAAYRDMYPVEPNLAALEYAVNAAIGEIRDADYVVLADGMNHPVESCTLKYTDDNKSINVQFAIYDRS